MLNEEIKKFEELTGHSANDYSMEFLGGFWFGYDTASNEERPQGEWLLLRTNYEDSGNNFYECSICHFSDIHVDSAEVPFCWHCGARMKNGKIPEVLARRAIKTKKDGQADE